ncbi:MAG: heme NO-binding domain-containing protein [Gammaproteobacteria bacterium]
MYGMVMKAIEQFVRTTHGGSGWMQVASANGLQYTTLIATDGYPDAQTMGLVQSAAALSGLSLDDMLRRLGDYWIDYALASPMRELMARSGRDIGEFLAGLNTLHTRAQLMFTDMSPPHFETHDLTPSSVRLVYCSSRAGLEPFVEGLFLGLGRMFNLQLRARSLPPSRPDVRAEYALEWTPNS